MKDTMNNTIYQAFYYQSYISIQENEFLRYEGHYSTAYLTLVSLARD